MKYTLPTSHNSRKTHLIMWLGLISVSLFSYNNCGNKVSFGVSPQSSLGTGLGDGSAGGLGTVDIGGAPDRLPDIMRDCATSPMLTQDINLYYENPQNLSCNFGINDNLVARDGYLQGRIEQDVNFELPAGSTVCGIDFQFPTQQMRYDDHMSVVYDNVIIASTYNFSDRLMPALDMSIYDWSRIVGAQWMHNANYEGIFCAGMASGDSTCVWPETDVLGTIDLDYRPIVFQRISALNPTRNIHQFKVVAIGDNDNGDCEHSPLSFNVRVSYVR